ncbi:S8 family serine peptidase [Streptomyces sp. RPA4-5]|uniref:S8 family serine peptidase n=1 Tax=Streptomyces TaxID=1883 RepID=UPI00143EACCC|nr:MULTISPECIES: S8 family serine peptidase [Streptomyces]MCX4635847.1 S8 family serine peptidase [Streptomyces platensis]QIY57880.1 S8 family serine peptidase [Streptomyces sp. RPA4-5]
MSFTRTLRAVGGVVAAGALLFVAAPSASADYIRDGQWALDAFNPQKVWKESTGKNVTVAVIDSGVNGEHVDLKGNVLPGKSFADGGGTAGHETGDDHGTAMAALIAGHGHGPHHADGIMGLAPDAKILPIKRNESMGGDANNIDGPLRYAVDHGAKVINMSFAGPYALTENEKSAISYAVKKDVLLVAGSGNDGTGKPSYPAAAPGVLAVGAVAEDGKVLGESNFGPHIRLIAPGEKIYSAGTSMKYRQATGTSDATAYVSAAAALVRSKFPDLTAGQVANRLTKTAITPDGKTGISSPDPKYGYGVIRPYRALSENIPAGAKNGPLTMPEESESSAGVGADAPGGDAQGGASGEKGISLSPLAVVGIVLGVVVVLGIVVGVVVATSKRRNGPPPGGTGFGGPGGGAGVPPQPHQYGFYQQPGNPGAYPSAPPTRPPGQ